MEEKTLRSPEALRAWFDDATSRPHPVVAGSEANLLNVFGAAVRALEKGENPPALFAFIVSGGRWDLISNEQEDRAREMLRMLYGQHDDPRRGPRPISDVIQERNRSADVKVG